METTVNYICQLINNEIRKKKIDKKIDKQTNRQKKNRQKRNKEM